MVLRVVDQRVAAALGRDSENWRVLNACPPCGYEVCHICFFSDMFLSRISARG